MLLSDVNQLFLFRAFDLEWPNHCCNTMWLIVFQHTSYPEPKGRRGVDKLPHEAPKRTFCCEGAVPKAFTTFFCLARFYNNKSIFRGCGHNFLKHPGFLCKLEALRMGTIFIRPYQFIYPYNIRPEINRHSEHSVVTIIHNMMDLPDSIRLFQHCNTGSIIICLGEDLSRHECIPDKEMYFEVFLDEIGKEVLRNYHCEREENPSSGPTSSTQDRDQCGYNHDSIRLGANREFQSVRWQSPFKRFLPEKRLSGQRGVY